MAQAEAAPFGWGAPRRKISHPERPPFPRSRWHSGDPAEVGTVVQDRTRIDPGPPGVDHVSCALFLSEPLNKASDFWSEQRDIIVRKFPRRTPVRQRRPLHLTASAARPRLEIDPRLLLFFRASKFELESSFKIDLKSGTTEREVALVGDLKATVWSKPIGKNVELSAGGGVVVEKRVKPSPETEASVFVFAKVEVKDVLKLPPLDLAKLQAEAQISVKPGSKEPPDMSVSVGVGPEVEAFGGTVTFAPEGYVEYRTNGSTHTVSGQVKITGTFHF